ncbi:DUF2628 domain-containing protein [Paenibacillus macerans]|uniref:Zinc-ribbon domain protein n=2 Tax=Paenibacillus macerans TaxID=44252 RepID=A0A090ZMI2_PAEMA|nr:DUF2628 domain-containing protein [Paenibacillus macerans]KFN11593.1 zinc-ribbon domain protein [Paenibacillus macerans]MEC0140757.1 DUF2628 domain-containing protein [Paenibacillus macerans]MEC0149325.1 DUF2628 domain-containing protein [Paenibacillus macerans]MEC0332850.1 DUF2628 domain-containing protein [Paenibacillus macerans]MED4955780.1 DUF2628 domain-containing protein [Paenibacillus macerans]
MYCSNCGKLLEKEDKFCAGCGAPAKPRQNEPAVPLPPAEPGKTPGKAGESQPPSEFGVPAEELELFIGKRAGAYFQKWRQDHRWNWPAFLFGGFWLLYRGMYLYWLIYLIVCSLIINIVGSLVFPGYQVSFSLVITMLTLQLALKISFAVAANSIYLHHARRKIKALGYRYPNDRETRETKIAQAGETSLYIPIALALLPFLLAVVYGLFSFLHTYQQIQQVIDSEVQESRYP